MICTQQQGGVSTSAGAQVELLASSCTHRRRQPHGLHGWRAPQVGQAAQMACTAGAEAHKLSPHEQLVRHELPRADGARLLRHDDGDAEPLLVSAGERGSRAEAAAFPERARVS